MQITKQKIERGYGEIEAAIAQVLKIEPADVPALRARLRHLRNMGLPDIPNPGSGRKILYTTFQAMEMLIAVVLQHNGMTSRHAAIMAPTISGLGVNSDPPFPYVMVSDTSSNCNITPIRDLGDIPQNIKYFYSDSFFFLNLSSYKLKLEDALKVRIDPKPER